MCRSPQNMIFRIYPYSSPLQHINLRGRITGLKFSKFARISDNDDDESSRTTPRPSQINDGGRVAVVVVVIRSLCDTSAL